MILSSYNICKPGLRREKLKNISTNMICTIVAKISLDKFYIVSIRIKTQGTKILLTLNDLPLLSFNSFSDKTLPFTLLNSVFVSTTTISAINGQFNLSPFDLRFFISNQSKLNNKYKNNTNLLSASYTR